jgi:hypothetical protein
MTTNPNASSDTLSESQTRLLKSVQQLQDEQKNTINAFASTSDPAEKKRLMDKMKQNETLQTTLLSSLGRVALVQTQEVANRRNAKMELTNLVELAEQELEDVRARVNATADSHSAKKRMIALNSYYGKRFMAQAGVMKIFIYMCIPVLVLAVLAKMGLLPQYIAGFIIIAVIVAGIIYMYNAVHDINRRDKVNFDEYTWEFDPSRVGDVVNPANNARHHGRRRRGHDQGSNGTNCVGSTCCDDKTTQWNEKSGTCVIQDAQGGGSAVKGETTQSNVASASASASASAATGLLGDLSGPTAGPTTSLTAGPTAGPTTSLTAGPTAGPTATTAPTPVPASNLCWSFQNRALTGQCMGDWTYDSATDTCTPPAGSAASQITGCKSYKVSDMSSDNVTPYIFDEWKEQCKVADSPNCTGPTPTNACWSYQNRTLKGSCMGDWYYNDATDRCNAPAGSAALQINGCDSYKVSDMTSANVTPDIFASFIGMCKVADSPNCT